MTPLLPHRRGVAWRVLLTTLAIVAVLLNAAIYFYGRSLSNRWSVKEVAVLPAPPDKVYQAIATPKTWPIWSAWNRDVDPTLKFSFEGPEAGEGATMSWIGRAYGDGMLTITKTEQPRRIEYSLTMQGQNFSDGGRFSIIPVAGGSRVTWSDGGELSGTMERLFRNKIEAGVRNDFSRSLERLKTVLEQPTISADQAAE